MPEKLSRRLLAVLVAAALALVAAPAAPAVAVETVGQCAPGLGIGLLQVPRATLADPRARNYVIDAVRPGATFSRDLQVCNGTSAPLTVSLYPDSATIVDGAFALAPGRGRNELTSWITLTPASVVVPPGKAVKATARFQVPLDATKGERYAGLVADAPPAPNGGFAVGGRVGIRVYLDVTTGGAPRSDFTVDSLQAVRRSDGSPAVLATVRNTGARALDLRGTLKLSDGPGGLSAGPFPAQLGTTLAPGDAAPVVVPLDKAIRGGPWHAVVDLRSGLLERRAEADVTFPDRAATAGVAVKAKQLPLYEDRGILVPLASALVGLLALVLLVLATLQWLRRRRVGSSS